MVFHSVLQFWPGSAEAVWAATTGVVMSAAPIPAAAMRFFIVRGSYSVALFPSRGISCRWSFWVPATVGDKRKSCQQYVNNFHVIHLTVVTDGTSSGTNFRYLPPAPVVGRGQVGRCPAPGQGGAPRTGRSAAGGGGGPV